MTDALVSPAVGGALWAAAAGAAVVAARRVERAADEARVPLMGVLGAFVFASQMVNFAIPGTGSSGHLAGGVLLAILLGADAAFLVMASVLTIQALFFADGGLLALGCNVVNMGLFASYVAYPLVWRPLAGRAPTRARVVVASLAAGVVGLQLGALGVVVETAASGISTLPLRTFALLMQPIHLAVGIVEGLVTAAVVAVVREARPELVDGVAPRGSTRNLLLGLACAAALLAGVVSAFASARPDGLEWAAARASSAPVLPEPPGAIHGFLGQLQRATALLPSYQLPRARSARALQPGGPDGGGGSLAGVVGACGSLALVTGVGVALRAVRRRAR